MNVKPLLDTKDLSKVCCHLEMNASDGYRNSTKQQGRHREPRIAECCDAAAVLVRPVIAKQVDKPNCAEVGPPVRLTVKN